MDIIVTIKSFDDELHQFDNLLPMADITFFATNKSHVSLWWDNL